MEKQMQFLNDRLLQHFYSIVKEHKINFFKFTHRFLTPCLSLMFHFVS